MEHGEAKKNWEINPHAFEKLLEWLDEGNNSEGQRYLEIRRRLVAYFDRKNCLMPDALADETLNRVARRLQEEKGAIISETPAKFCYISARFVFLEYLRDAGKTHLPLDDAAGHSAASADETEERNRKEKMLDCLEQCTSSLDVVSRELITEYYFGEERIKIENRRQLAQKLSISINALSIRACRIRSKLEICVKKCAGSN